MGQLNLSCAQCHDQHWGQRLGSSVIPQAHATGYPNDLPVLQLGDVIEVPIEAKTDLEITLLANLITLTPGTLTLDVAPDRKSLYVHAMFVDDPEQIRAEIKNGMERRLLEVMR